MFGPNFNDPDEKPGNVLPPQDDPLLEKVKAYILSLYEPVQDPKDADLRMSTEEIYQAVCRHYHNELLFSKNMLAAWLHDKGFTFYDAGQLRFEWLLKNI
jgi:hypothetical protein